MEYLVILLEPIILKNLKLWVKMCVIQAEVKIFYMNYYVFLFENFIKHFQSSPPTPTKKKKTYLWKSCVFIYRISYWLHRLSLFIVGGNYTKGWIVRITCIKVNEGQSEDWLPHMTTTYMKGSLKVDAAIFRILSSSQNPQNQLLDTGCFRDQIWVPFLRI